MHIIQSLHGEALFWAQLEEKTKKSSTLFHGLEAKMMHWNAFEYKTSQK